jgi:uncharacterized protein (TIGR00159 family)
MLLGFHVGFLEVHWLDIVDVLLVTSLLYHLYKLVKGSVALKVFVGFLSLYLVYLVVKATEMALLSEILGEFMGVGVIAALILFQNEFRRFLMLIGSSTDLQDLFPRWGRKQAVAELEFEPLLAAMKSMSATLTGALMVVSKDDPLTPYVESGDWLDAKVSKRLITSIFFKNAPLHDGALIIFNNRIVAARCILPVSQNPSIPANMGLRHRAGIGLTEVADVVVLTVSEETGKMSFIRKGEVRYDLNVHEIRGLLLDYWEQPEVREPLLPVPEGESAQQGQQ